MKNKQNVALDLNKLIGEANVIASGARAKNAIEKEVMSCQIKHRRLNISWLRPKEIGKFTGILFGWLRNVALEEN